MIHPTDEFTSEKLFWDVPYKIYQCSACKFCMYACDYLMSTFFSSQRFKFYESWALFLFVHLVTSHPTWCLTQKTYSVSICYMKKQMYEGHHEIYMWNGMRFKRGWGAQETFYRRYCLQRALDFALAGVAHWVECHTTNQKVNGSVPCQGTCLGCRPGPP